MNFGNVDDLILPEIVEDGVAYVTNPEGRGS